MDIKKELNEVFILYSKWDYLKAKELNDKILEIEPNNVYALKYAKFLSSKISSTPNSNKKARAWWKVIKCPHCLAKIPFSGLNEEQRQKIKDKAYNNLEIKCPYCHTKFVLQKRKAKSILGIKIWDIANIDWKKYRVTGYVQYSWRWYEDSYSWWVRYLEWLLLWEDNSYLYFSEWESEDDWVWEREFEISKKYIPKQIWKIDYIVQVAEIDWKNLYAKEKDRISVKSVYWENSKNTTVWEKVEIYDFWDIIIEKESSWWQTEAGFYKTKEISGKKAASYFGKEYNILHNFWTASKKVWSKIWNFSLVFLYIWFIFFPLIIEFLSSIIFWEILWIWILWFSVYYFRDSFWETWKKYIYWWLAWLLTIFISSFIFSSILENKKEIALENINIWKKYEIDFLNSWLQTIKTTW